MDADLELNGAWTSHGDEPQAVFARLPALAEAVTAAQAPRLLRLAVHVGCEHLRRDPEVRALVDAVALRFPTEPAVGWTRHALALLDGAGPSFDAPPEHEAEAVAAVLGIAAVRGEDELVAVVLDRSSVVAFRLAASHPALRALAAAANDAAATLEEREGRTPVADRNLRTAATLARTLWERAGTWLEVERAEYRLSRTHLALGEVAAGLTHAEMCLAICQGNRAGPEELVFAWEVLALACTRAGATRRAADALAWGRALIAAPDFPDGLRAAARSALDAAAKVDR
jgi:hypothetical protein